MELYSEKDMKLHINLLRGKIGTHLFLHMTSPFFCCLTEEERNNILTTHSYSSVLALQGKPIQEKMEQVEDKGIVPCITGWCNHHHKVSIIAHTHLLQEYYKKPIEYYIHLLMLESSI